jgi:hypothetical protein
MLKTGSIRRSYFHAEVYTGSSILSALGAAYITARDDLSTLLQFSVSQMLELGGSGKPTA